MPAHCPLPCAPWHVKKADKEVNSISNFNFSNTVWRVLPGWYTWWRPSFFQVWVVNVNKTLCLWDFHFTIWNLVTMSNHGWNTPSMTGLCYNSKYQNGVVVMCFNQLYIFPPFPFLIPSLSSHPFPSFPSLSLPSPFLSLSSFFPSLKARKVPSPYG